MKRLIATTALTACALVPAWAQAETIHSVTQVNYDGVGRPVCTAVRMNPAAYGTLPSDACALGTESTSFGPDRITKNTYDDAGQLLQVDQAYGTSVQRAYARYTYTVNGKKATNKDANGNLTTLEYDGFGRLKTLRYPNVAIGSGTSSATDYEQYSYDANGNRLTWRRRNNITINYTYDKLNRVTLEDHPAIAGVQTATEKDVYTAYDGLGHIASKRFASTSGNGVSYGYDGLGRVNSTTDMYGRTVGYTYNTASARNTMTYHGGVVQSYTLDNFNRLTGSTVGGSNFSLGYDSLGRVTSVSRNNSTTTAYGYDGLGRLTSMGHDLTGTANDVTWAFTGRNPAGQITSWTATSTTYDYKEKASKTVNTGYDGLNRDSTISILPGGYDANGNLANETTQDDLNAANKRCMTYDTMNRLLKVTKCSTPSVPDLTLTYDPEGRLAAYTANLTTTEFLYDGVNLIAEYTHSSPSGHGSDGMTRRYVHGTGIDLPLLWFMGASVSTGGQFYVTNYQGSIIGNSNASGNLTELYKYGPYGEPTNAQGDEFWSGARFRYTGQYIIPEAKLYYYKARVYDPYYGRFLQTDPIGSLDDLNLYLYVRGDPVNSTDPMGLRACPTGDPNCVETPESENDPSKPKPPSPEEEKTTAIVITGKRKKLRQFRFTGRKETSWVADQDEMKRAELTQRDYQCPGGEYEITVGQFKLPSGSAGVHSHSNSHSTVPSGGDNIAAKNSTMQSAYMVTSTRVFRIELEAGGRYRTTVVDGPPLSDKERSELVAGMQNWESGNAENESLTPQERFCPK